MNTASTIIKSIILPLLIKFSKGDLTMLPDDFWNQFAADFIYYETAATPIYTSLYQLELQDPEAVFEKLPEAYSSFIKELAEDYVLENQSELTAQLIESKNETFLKEVSFLKTMKAVITKVERQKLKKNLPILYDRLVFELDEETLRQVAKKKSREDLRTKFKKWDEEMVESEPILVKYSLSHNVINEAPNEYNLKPPKTKVISLSWIKYAVAACVVLTAGVLYFKLSTNTIENSIQPTEDKVVTKEVPNIETEDIADITTVPDSYKVLEDVGFGFAATPKKISVIENHQEQRIVSIRKAIANIQMILGKELVAQKSVSGSKAEELKSRISSLQDELSKMKEKENQYIFDGKKLTLFISKHSKENRVLLYEDNYYLIKDKDFYKLAISKQPQFYKKETDTNVLKALDKIIFDNEE
jgi:hypothetical protein